MWKFGRKQKINKRWLKTFLEYLNKIFTVTFVPVTCYIFLSIVHLNNIN